MKMYDKPKPIELLITLGNNLMEKVVLNNL